MSHDITSIKNKVKKSLMIPLEETYADDELALHINACFSLIRSAGVKDDVAYSENGLAEALVLIYCKTFYGFKNDGSVKELPSSFDFLLRQLALTSEV
jgi:formyltetrahydrofolate synthetase